MRVNFLVPHEREPFCLVCRCSSFRSMYTDNPPKWLLEGVTLAPLTSKPNKESEAHFTAMGDCSHCGNKSIFEIHVSTFEFVIEEQGATKSDRK